MKKSFTLISASLLTLTVIGAATSASAASISANQWDSKGTVSFTENNTVPPVTNPGIPDKQPDITGVTGPLAIDYASDLDFGTHQVQSGTQTYYAKADAVTGGAAQVRMHDQRGAAKGWDVSVQQKGQFTDGTTDLTGAQLAFSKGVSMNVSSTGTYVPTYNSSLSSLDPAATSGVKVMEGDGTVGGYATVFGTTADYTANTDGTTETPISLTVPSGKVGTFTTTLEYTLTAAQ